MGALGGHVLEALGVDGVGPPARTMAVVVHSLVCLLCHVSVYISSECDVTYTAPRILNLSSNELRTRWALQLPRLLLLLTARMKGRQRYETNELVDRCGDMETE